MNGFEIQCLPGHADLAVTNMGATSGNTSPAEWLLDWATMGQSSDSGEKVNGYTALTNCALYQGVQTIAGDVAQVPIRLVRNEFDDQKTHPSWKLLRLRPNALQTPSVFTETLMQWALIWGNGLAWIIRNGSRPVELIPLRPDCVWPELISFDEQQVILYHYWSPTTGKEYVFFEYDVVHIQGLTGDGVWGYPLFQIAKNTIGQGLALEKHGNKSFKNSARPSGVLRIEGKLSPEARASLRQEWDALHSGSDNTGRIAILQDMADFKALSMTNIDAQWIEARKYNALDCARLLNLPPYKLNIMDDSANRANLEEQNADYTQRTLSRHFNRLAEEYRRKLLTEKEWLSDEYRYIFDVDEFLRADIETMSTVADQMVKSTILNPNEARRKFFRLPPRNGGEVYGSPAINPNKDLEQKKPENEPESDEKPPEKRENRANLVRNALRDTLIERLEHVVQNESTRLAHAAEHSKNFVSWLDEFYLGSEEKPAKLLAMYDTIMEKHLAAANAAGLNTSDLRGMVYSWCVGRKKSILEATSNVNQGELVNCVRAFVIPNPATFAKQFIGAAVEN